MIRIPLSFHRDGDAVSLLPDAAQRKTSEATVQAGLASDDPYLRAEAESLRQVMDLYAEVAEDENAVHLVAVFRDPTWSDKPAMYAKALQMAQEAGAPDAVNAFLVPLRVVHLLDHVEDRDGARVAEGIPECLYEWLGRKLEAYLYGAVPLTELFTPAARNTPAGKTASRKAKSAAAK